MKIKHVLKYLAEASVVIGLLTGVAVRSAAAACGDATTAQQCEADCPALAACLGCCSAISGPAAPSRTCQVGCTNNKPFIGELNSAQDHTCDGTLESTSRGTAVIDFNPATLQIDYYVTWGSNSPDYDNGILQGGAVSAGHFHTDPSGAVQVGTGAANPSVGSATLTAAQASDLLAGRWYHNVHSTTCPSGEIRGQMLSATPVPAASIAWMAVLGTLLALGGAAFIRARRQPGAPLAS